MTLLPQWRGQPSTFLAGYFARRFGDQFPQALWRGHPARHELALTFDDGPHPRDTPQLLEVLARYEVKATFFVIGERAQRYPHLIHDIAAAGHQLGIHGYHHRAFPTEIAGRLRLKLGQAQAVIAEASARPPATIASVRPPFGFFTPSTLVDLRAWGYQPVMWSIVPFHWLQAPELSIQQALQQAHNGALLVLHESQKGPPVAELADSMLRGLVAAEYAFVTVDQLQSHLDGGE